MTVPSQQLDKIEVAIVENLEINGRLPVATLAKKLAVDTKVINRRLGRLLDERFIRIMAVPHPGVLGYHKQAYVMLNVKPNKLSTVAEKLTSYSSVHMVMMTAGIFDIVGVILTRNMRELSTLLREEIATIPGIDKMETSVCLDIPKASMSYLSPHGHLFANGPVLDSTNHTWPELDETDLDIIRILERNGRRPVTEISRELGVSRPTVHKKLQLLLEYGCIRVVALSYPMYPNPMGEETMVMIGLNPRLKDIATTVEALADHPKVHSILTTTGRYKIVIAAWFEGSQQLSDFLKIRLGAELHLDNAEVLTIIDTPKFRMSVPT